MSLTKLDFWNSTKGLCLILGIGARCNKTVGENQNSYLSSNSMGHQRLKAFSVLESSALYVSRDPACNRNHEVVRSKIRLP